MSSITIDEGALKKQPELPLPLMIKVAYGAPSFAGAAMAIPIGIHLTIFYSDTILVPLGVIALVKAMARALDLNAVKFTCNAPANNRKLSMPRITVS